MAFLIHASGLSLLLDPPSRFLMSLHSPFLTFALLTIMRERREKRGGSREQRRERREEIEDGHLASFFVVLAQFDQSGAG